MSGIASYLAKARVATWTLALASGIWPAAQAAENGLQRYLPGLGGSDMAMPIIPGWYGQAAAVAYRSDTYKDSAGRDATYLGGAIGLQSKVRINVLMNRLTYIDSGEFLGGTPGWTVAQPLVSFDGRFGAKALEAGYEGVATMVDAMAASSGGRVFGIGDTEVGPLLHWTLGDKQALTAITTVVIPTGDYSPYRKVNAGLGNFYTIRAAAQYAYFGDAFDFGMRSLLSLNTRNKSNGYYSGNMFNVDFQLMKFISEEVRVGLQGYVLRQLNRDTQKLEGFSAADQNAFGALSDASLNAGSGNKASANAVGPAVAWLKGGGDFLLEAKVVKEFGAKNRTQGQAVWITLSKPL